MDAIIDDYSILKTPIDHYSNECDHRVSLAIGGANLADSLLPQPNLEAAVKDVCEVEVQRRACHGAMSLAEGQAVFLSDDWPLLCRGDQSR